MKRILIVFLAIPLISSLHCSENNNPTEYNKVVLSGSVTDKISLIKIHNALIQSSNTFKSTTSDSQGFYSLNDLEMGLDTITVVAKGYDSLISVMDFQTKIIEKDFCLESSSNITCTPVEDTNRVYYSPNTGNPIELYPKALYVRFYPWVTDTTQIMGLLEKYNLELMYGLLSSSLEQITASLCIKQENTRSECYYTPYGRLDEFDNFGTDSLVEYSYGVFTAGHTPYGPVRLLADTSVSLQYMDSIFHEYGLRYRRKNHDWGTSKIWYTTIITPDAPMNALDLGFHLKTVKHIENVNVGMLQGMQYWLCD